MKNSSNYNIRQNFSPKTRFPQNSDTDFVHQLKLCFICAHIHEIEQLHRRVSLSWSLLVLVVMLCSFFEWENTRLGTTQQ